MTLASSKRRAHKRIRLAYIGGGRTDKSRTLSETDEQTSVKGWLLRGRIERRNSSTLDSRSDERRRLAYTERGRIDKRIPLI